MAITINGDTGVTYPVTAGSASALQASSSKVLQVVSTTKTDTFSESLAANTNSSTNCIQVSITPSSATSQILIMVSINGSSDYWAGANFGGYQGRLVRGSTSIAIGDAAGSRNRMTMRAGAYSNQVSENMCFTFLDSPATTSSTTYGFRLDNVDNATRTYYLNRAPTDTDSATGICRTASSITVMEIAA